MRKKVLVTGSNGLLGQKITDYCLAHLTKYELCATGKGSNRHPHKADYIYHEMDILDSKQMEKVIRDFNPHFVIHTAAMTHVDVCEEEKMACLNLNVTSVESLIHFSTIYHFHLIQISTDFIFDGTQGPYKENDVANPLSYYGKTKLLSEEKLINSSISWTIIRTILVYGITSDMNRSNFVLWAKKSLENKSVINVVDDQWRMPTLAEDLAKACFLAIDKKATGIYHISGSTGGTIYELIRSVAKFWGLDETLINKTNTANLSQKASRPEKTGFVLKKAITELNYTPSTFEQGLHVLNKQLKEIQTV